MQRRTWLKMALLLSLVSMPALCLAQEAPQPATPDAPAPATPDAPAPTTPDATPATPEAGQPTGGTVAPTGGTTAPTDGKQSPFGSLPMILVLGLGMLALIWWSNRSRRKQESKRQEMLASIKKGDKVTTIGGIMGTIIEAREDEVIIKVDENTNTRLHMARWALRGIGDEGRTAPDERRK